MICRTCILSVVCGPPSSLATPVLSVDEAVMALKVRSKLRASGGVDSLCCRDGGESLLCR